MGDTADDDKNAFLRTALTRHRDFFGPPAAIVPFATWDYFYTRDPLQWQSNTDATKTVNVPVGFVTDLASVPRIFWSALPRTAAYSYPAVIHDYLYWFQPCAREEADDVLKSAMADLNVSVVDSTAIYTAVRAAGEFAWDKNARARQAGEKRVLTKFPTDMRTTWEQWKADTTVFAP